VEASVIKNITDHRRLEAALEIYDTVVLPMTANDDEEFLVSLPDKDRIRLLVNGGCALTCPIKICYQSFSKMNKFRGGEFQCSQTMKSRELVGMIDFDIEELRNLGIKRFKLLRERQGGMTGI